MTDGLKEHNFYDSIYTRRLNIFGDSHWATRESYDKSQLCWSIVEAYKQEIDSIEKVFLPIFTGFKMAHRFRSNNGFGAKMIYELVFFFDPKISKVVKLEETTND